jgi:hypothetical protein
MIGKVQVKVREDRKADELESLIMPGSHVHIGPVNNPIDGTVISVMIVGKDLMVSYEVEWWSGDDCRMEMIDGYRVRPVTKERIQVGFRL